MEQGGVMRGYVFVFNITFYILNALNSEALITIIVNNSLTQTYSAYFSRKTYS